MRQTLVSRSSLRGQGPLDEATNEILAARRDIKQEVHAVSLDLGNPSEVRSTNRLEPTMFDREMADWENSLMRSSDPKLDFQMFLLHGLR
jgi:hypothetical protein